MISDYEIKCLVTNYLNYDIYNDDIYVDIKIIKRKVMYERIVVCLVSIDTYKDSEGNYAFEDSSVYIFEVDINPANPINSRIINMNKPLNRLAGSYFKLKCKEYKTPISTKIKRFINLFTRSVI